MFIILFFQREGPPPGQYKLSKDSILPKGPNVTSPFKSKTPRFVQPHVLVMSSIRNTLSCNKNRLQQSCPILPHCYGPLRAVNGPYVLHKPSLLLTVRMLSTYGACISLLHEGTMRYGSFDPYGPKTYGACISLVRQGTMHYGSFDPYSP